MNARRPLALFLAGLLALPAFGAAPAAAEPAAKPKPEAAKATKVLTGFVRTRARIIDILGPRLLPVPLVDNPPNPFANPAGAANTITQLAEPAPGPGAPGEPAATTAAPAEPVDELARLAQGLRIGGSVMRRGQPNLIVNGNVYGVGDMITVRDGEQIHLLRIKAIERNRLVLEMDDKETTVTLR
jgi:hypothetical protein